MATMDHYHRRSSATTEKLRIPTDLLRFNSIGQQCGGTSSDRQRSQSLFPGSPGISPRSRSHSISGASGLEGKPTESEEEHIFQCYTRVMHILLGGLAAVFIGLVFYGLCNFSSHA